MSGSQSIFSAHVSSLYNTSRIQNVKIPTVERGDKFADPEEDAEFYMGHATATSYFNAAPLPPLLLRLVDNNYTIQLTSVTAHIPPISLTFSAPILEKPFIVHDLLTDVHVIVCTKSGYLYRLVLPGPGYWTAIADPYSSSWRSEYQIKSVSKDALLNVYVPEPGLVFIALKDGNVLRLTAPRSHPEAPFEEWRETVLYPSSGLALPSLSLFSSRLPGSSNITAFASGPSEKGAEVVFSLSRDRTIRFWKDKCIGSLQVPATFEAAARGASTKSHTLIPMSHGTLLRVNPPLISAEGDADANSELIVFIPTPAEDAGGFFVVYHLSLASNNGARQLEWMGAKKCAPQTAGCELRDFVVVDNLLWCLWDTHGRASVQVCDFSPETDLEDSMWQQVSGQIEPDYSPTYFDNLLLSDVTLNEAFMSVLLRPGVFSRYTLETALHQYLATLQPVSGSLASRMSYPTVGEHIASVVGSTVSVNIDPQTGEQLWDQYWSTLKRDWEGFIARCSEIERGARWPVSFGVGSDGEILVLERERLGVIAADDLPLQLDRIISLAAPPPTPSAAHALLDIATMLRKDVPAPERQALESSIVSVAHEVVAFGYNDIALDIADRLLMPYLDPKTVDWVQSRLTQIADINEGLLEALRAMTDIDLEAKGELMEEELDGLNGRDSSATAAVQEADYWRTAQWPKALAASYLTSTISSRYQLCLSLLIMCVFLTYQTPADLDSEPPLIATAFDTFRSISIIQRIATVPASHSDAPQESGWDEDAIVDKLRGMRMSSLGPTTPPKISYSLLQSLLPSITITGFKTLPLAHGFLRSTGLLVKTEGRPELGDEVALIRLLEDLGQANIAFEISEWLPLSPPIAYVRGVACLDLGRAEEAADLFNQAAAALDEGGIIRTQGSLAMVDALDSIFTLAEYFWHISSLFEQRSLFEHVAVFARLAIEAAAPGAAVEEMWSRVFNALVNTSLYEEAYSSILAMPDAKWQMTCVEVLVNEMCNHGEVDRLTRLNFVGHQATVEERLAFKARTSDPSGWPNYTQVLYSWHLFRGDYRSAGQAMFLRARKLKIRGCAPGEYVELATEMAKCYLSAINCLSLVDRNSAWVALPRIDKNKKTNGDYAIPVKIPPIVPDEKWSVEKISEIEIVELPDIQREYMTVLSQLELAQRYPQHDAANLIIGPTDIVSRFVQEGAFDDALSSARSLKVTMASIFENLAENCVRLSKAPVAIRDEFVPWLTSDRVQSWGGTLSQRAWRYLQESLDRNDGPETDYEYRKTVLETILQEDRFFRLPSWLVQWFEQNLPEYYIRTCFKFGLIEDASRQSIRLVKETQRESRGVAKTGRRPFKTSAATWLPYGLFDQIIDAAQNSPERSLHGLASDLRKELEAWSTYAKRLATEIRT